MNYSVDEQYNVVIITLRGNVMGGPTATKFQETISALKEEGKLNVVVNLARVRIMNSSGLGMLISAMTSMRKAGGDLRLSNPASKIRSLLVITKLITVFEHFDSDQEAAESFKASS